VHLRRHETGKALGQTGEFRLVSRQEDVGHLQIVVAAGAGVGHVHDPDDHDFDRRIGCCVDPQRRGGTGDDRKDGRSSSGETHH
jgi:hypothetical protein